MACWTPIASLSAAALLGAGVALTQPPPESERDGLVGTLRTQLDELADRARRAVWGLREEGRTVRRPAGVWMLSPGEGAVRIGDHQWKPPEQSAPERIVLLVHGLDEPGSIWDDLTPALRDAGYDVARFDYPNDQPIADSGDLLGAALRDLKARGVKRVDLVGHSMGGLIARDVLTREGLYAGRARGHDDLPDVPRLITVGTPNAGSPWAKLRAIAEIREQAERFFSDPARDWRGLLGYLGDGMGEAGDDLLPGSAYLAGLNARPLPRDVAITIIAGRMAPVQNEDLAWLAESWLLKRLVGREDAEKLAEGIHDLSTQLGDGVVPVASTPLRGVEDVVLLEGANHRTMLRASRLIDGARGLVGEAPSSPEAIPVILDRLAR